MELLIVGAGSMGRWLAEAVGDDVAFADAEPAAARSAAAAAGGRAVALDTDERFDVVAIAVPMGVATEAIATHADTARGAIVDLAGVMAGPTAAMAEHAPEVERASLHPLFAPANAPGRIAVVADDAGPTVARIRAELTEVGNTFIETTPEEHDRAMETVQARAHAAVLAFGLAAEPVPEGFGTPVYDVLEELLAEVTGGTPRVYADIQESFDGADDIAAAAERIAAADGEAFERLYREAGNEAGGFPESDADR
jgi:prephenate dehydrogenase